MDGSSATLPVFYSDNLEKPGEDEQQVIAELVETMRGISEKTHADGSQALRSVHAKSHGLLRGEIEVLPDLPTELAQGVFAQARRYPVIVRLSTPPGDVLTDAITLPRGMAVKLEGVSGEQLPRADETATGTDTQDFVMVNAPVFQAPDAKHFLASLKLLAKTTDRAEGLKKAASSVFRGVEKVVEAMGGESAKLKSMGGHAQTHPLGETFYTVVPLRYGRYIAKLRFRPSTGPQLALQAATVDLQGDADGLRRIVNEYFAVNAAEWEIGVQLCTDLSLMPIEDASVEWPEDRSAYRPVARMRIAVQSAWDERTAEAERQLSFSPWHGIEAHRPLGSIMRARRPAYEMSTRFRREHGGCPVLG